MPSHGPSAEEMLSHMEELFNEAVEKERTASVFFTLGDTHLAAHYRWAAEEILKEALAIEARWGYDAE